MELQLVQSEHIESSLHREIVAMCNHAYGEDLAGLFATFGEATHVIGTLGNELVSHAMWVTRWLAPNGRQPLKTAYVEMVATSPPCRRRGYAGELMRRLQAAIPASYALAALCPATQSLYARLGWQTWRGPLSIRCPDGVMRSTPDEQVMIRVLPQTPPLDLDGSLSAEWREGELW